MAEAKLYLGAYEDALNLCHRSIELNRNYPTARFTYCAAILVELGRLDEAKSEVKAGLALSLDEAEQRRHAHAESSEDIRVFADDIPLAWPGAALAYRERLQWCNTQSS